MDTDEKLRFQHFTQNLLGWYGDTARDLAWRVGPKARASGERPDPYRVWLAEIMLQQTTIAHATPYYLKFTARWPQVEDLAAADDADIMAAWAGLGYYARARNLLKCARHIADQDGQWPRDYDGLQALPGIGPYTAGAVAALAFDLPYAAVDANVERVFSRLLRLTGDWSAQKQTIRDMVQRLVPPSHPAEFAEALMDLGATLCTPKRPDCAACPVQGSCLAQQHGDAERYPSKPPKPVKPMRLGHVYVAVSATDNVMTETRPASGLLGGMLGLPTSQWQNDTRPPASYPFAANWQSCGEVRHVFTHFALNLQVWRAELGNRADQATPVDKAVDALPTVFRKALRLALKPVDK